jgi:hypothetical protein
MTETNTNALMAILPGLLVPLLASGPEADRGLAHRAALQAIEAYRASTQGELVTIAQIIGFGLAALDDLSLSMATDLSVSAKLRLRGNANALNRASLRATAALDRIQQPMEPGLDEWAGHDPSAIELTASEPPASEPLMPEPLWPDPPARQAVSDTLPLDQQNRLHWANAMASVAAELRTRATQVPHAQIPHAQRKSDRLWVEVLTNVASELRQPDAAPNYPGLSKAELLRTTLMAGGGFPGHLVAKSRPGRTGQ